MHIQVGDVQKEFGNVVIAFYQKNLKKSLDQELIRIIDGATPKMWTLIRQVCVCVCMYIYMYVYVCVCVCICIYILYNVDPYLPGVCVCVCVNMIVIHRVCSSNV